MAAQFGRHGGNRPTAWAYRSAAEVAEDAEKGTPGRLAWRGRVVSVLFGMEKRVVRRAKRLGQESIQRPRGPARNEKGW